jgi:subtilisin family serine protease
LTVAEILQQLAADPEVDAGEPNFIAQLPEIDTRSFVFIDTRSFVFIDGESPGEYFDQWALNRIQADAALNLARGEGVEVAVIDTGIDLDHPAFQGRISPDMRDFVDDDANPCEGCDVNQSEGPGFGHGTFVAGLIALVAPDAAIMPIRAFDAEGRGTTFDIAQAIQYAANRGALVINMSFGLSTRSFALEAAISLARNQGAFMVASAGNEGDDVKQYPAAYDQVIAVAATDANDVIADFSNFGSHIAVCAPGVGVYSAYPGSRFGIWSGTSFSAPFVAGEAALLYSTTPRLTRRTAITRNRINRAITETAVNIDANNPGLAGQLGAGRIDVLEAVRRITSQSSRSQSGQW